MSSLTTQRGAPSMTAPITLPAKANTVIPTRTAINYKTNLLRWIAALQYINLASILWVLVVPEASRGLLGFVQRDYNIPPMLFATLFAFGIGVSWRALKSPPRYGLLVMLSGQSAVTLAALVYALRGLITPAQLAGHGGLFVVCALSLVAIVQYDHRDTRPHGIPAPRLHAATLLIPAIGLILLMYACGLSMRPDAGIVIFIADHVGQIWNEALIAWMALGGGFVVLNHVAPKWLFIVILSVGVYGLLALFLLASDNGVSFTGILSHGELFVTMMFVAVIQIQEYAAAERERAAR